LPSIDICYEKTNNNNFIAISTAGKFSFIIPFNSSVIILSIEIGGTQLVPPIFVGVFLAFPAL